MTAILAADANRGSRGNRTAKLGPRSNAAGSADSRGHIRTNFGQVDAFNWDIDRREEGFYEVSRRASVRLVCEKGETCGRS